MPVEIVQKNERLAEVRILCDRCGKEVLTLLLELSRAEAQRDQQHLCRECFVNDLERLKNERL